MAKEITEEELNKYKKPVYAEEFNCIKVEARIKNGRTQIVLINEDKEEITYKLVKTVKKEEYDKELNMSVEEEQTEQVKKDEINKHIPPIFKQISEYIKENGSIKLYISYSQTALAFDTDIVVYKFMRDYQVDTIYSKAFFKDDDRLARQYEMKEKYEERRKGETVEV